MPGINSRCVFINQNRDRAKNPRAEIYTRFPRCGWYARGINNEINITRLPQYGASSVINAHPVRTTRRSPARRNLCASCERRIYEDRPDLRFEKRPERIVGRRAAAASRLIFIRRETRNGAHAFPHYRCARPLRPRCAVYQNYTLALPKIFISRLDKVASSYECNLSVRRNAVIGI